MDLTCTPKSILFSLRRAVFYFNPRFHLWTNPKSSFFVGNTGPSFLGGPFLTSHSGESTLGSLNGKRLTESNDLLQRRRHLCLPVQSVTFPVSIGTLESVLRVSVRVIVQSYLERERFVKEFTGTVWSIDLETITCEMSLSTFLSSEITWSTEVYSNRKICTGLYTSLK